MTGTPMSQNEQIKRSVRRERRRQRYQRLA